MAVNQALGLLPTEDPKAWTLHVHEGVVTDSGALLGGVGFGAAIEAMVAASGRPLVWATAQFLSHAALDSVLDLEVTLSVEGHKVSQARGRLTQDGDEVLSALAALGTRDTEIHHVWPDPPDVPAPEECPKRYFPRDDLLQAWDGRIARGRSEDQLDGTIGPGRSASWYRRPDGSAPVAAGELAVIGDFSMAELADSVGFLCLGNSLDHTLRINRLVETEWVLLDATVTHVGNGFAPISANLWSEDRTLLGVFSQTVVLRRVDENGRPIRTDKRFAGH